MKRGMRGGLGRRQRRPRKAEEIRESRRAAPANEGETIGNERTTATVADDIPAPPLPVDAPTQNEIVTKIPVPATILTIRDLVPALHDDTPTLALLHPHLASLTKIDRPYHHPIESPSSQIPTRPPDNPQVLPVIHHHPPIKSDPPPQRQSPAR